MSLKRKCFNISFAPTQLIGELMQILKKEGFHGLDGVTIHAFVVCCNYFSKFFNQITKKYVKIKFYTHYKTVMFLSIFLFYPY